MSWNSVQLVLADAGSYRLHNVRAVERAIRGQGRVVEAWASRQEPDILYVAWGDAATFDTRPGDLHVVVDAHDLAMRADEVVEAWGAWACHEICDGL